MHHALVPDENRAGLLVVDGALPAVDSKRLRTPLVADTLEREIGLRAPFLRASAVVRDEDGWPRTALLEFDAPRSPPRGSWVALDEAPGLVPSELRDAAEQWVAEHRGAPIPEERAPWARPGWLAGAAAFTLFRHEPLVTSEEILGLGAVDRRLDTLEVPPELSGRLDALRDLLMFGSDEDRPPLLEAYGVAPEVFELAAPLARIHHAISYERILEAIEPSDRWIFAEVPGQLRERALGNASQPG